MAFSLEDYVDVAERLRLFYEKYPDGRIVTSHVTYKEWGPITGMFATAEAYRTADDPHPAVGTAWEPVPGKTQFTRDSEVQNAETAAWGRAIVAAGIGTKRIASLEEVRNRSEDSRSPRGVSRSPARVAKPAAQPTASAPAAPPADERSPRPPVPPDQGAGRAASKPYPPLRGSAAQAGDEHTLSTNDLKLPPSARKVITAAQRKKLFALARGYNMSDPTIRTIVEAVTGSRSTAEIQRKDFDVLLERIELEGRGAEA